MTQSGGPAPDFAAAATRHLGDANYLLAESRHISADHLAGFAAECFLKSMLLAFMGGQVAKGPPFTVDPSTGQRREYRHLPHLWSDLSLHLSGRTGAMLGGLLSAGNPFLNWGVEDRYSDGQHIQVTDTQDRVAAANHLGIIHQQARLNGTLP